MSVFHGSDLEKIEEVYGIKKEEIISFAANVNPLGLPESFVKAMSTKLHCIEHYPDREYKSLKKAIGEYCGTDPENIMIGNGSSELISGVIKHKKAPETLIIAPAYSEYERNVRIAGGRPDYFDLKEEDEFCIDAKRITDSIKMSHDLVIICNPVNPTSSACDKRDMEIILERCRECNAICVVDETYVDFADEKYDISSLTERFKCLFVIRSMSKFFCAPGLRLGYAVTSDKALRDEIKENMDPWSVSSFAEEAGQQLLNDDAFIKKSREYMFAERDRICAILDDMGALGLKYYKPQANFILIRLPEGKTDAHDLFERAIRDRMMIRDCSTFRGLDERFVRFCIMKREDNDRLLSLIREGIS